MLTRSTRRAERYEWSDRVQAFTGHVLDPFRPRNQGLLAFDPNGAHWAEAGQLDSASRHGEQRVWTGRQPVQIGGQDAADEAISAVVVDPCGGTGLALPSVPEPRSNTGAVWTGTELLVWGRKPDTPMG